MTNETTQALKTTAREWRAIASALAKSGDVAGSYTAEHYARECETAAREIARPIVIERPFRA